ncbi:hypothetical protein JNA64_00600 [Pseudomonas stutzeri]|uniref:hypothetical protein n=1 Tax=Stutzerimonas stutzeri TaxID=316 RepID=UPI001F524543|nr:hypothetical protein [Stutzerimonas stutzeri]MCI0915658.1 hypothetical protein [Stutzerimonas stutzeri]
MDPRQDKRTLHALRKHIDELLASGAMITSRDPVTIVTAGETLKVRQGMLVGYSGFLDMVEPAADHDWPDALRQMAIDLCIKQLDQAIETLERRQPSTTQAPAANDGSVVG